MTEKKKKEWLLEAVRSRERVDELLKEAERVRARAEKACISWDSVGHSSNFAGSRVESCAVKLADLENAILVKMEEYAAQSADAFRAIEGLSSPKQRRLMHLRYFGGMTWECIAETMGVDIRTCTRMHGIALQAMEIPSK